MKRSLLIPRTDWETLTSHLLEFKLGNQSSLPNDVSLELETYGYLSQGAITDDGENLLNQQFVRRNDSEIRAIHAQKLIELPATQALLQAIWGLSNVDVEQVKHALAFAGADLNDVGKSVTHFLTILNQFNIVRYSKKLRTIRALVSPLDTDHPPKHVFVNPTRPYANSYWIRKIISECQGSLCWIDKYFDKSAIEWLWREATSEKVSRITIISAPQAGQLDKTTLGDYRSLVKELAHRGIALEWRLLPREKSHLIHDRWIFDDSSLCYNLPSTGTIHSGQSSELLRSDNHSQVLSLFDSLLPETKLVQ